MVGPAPAFNSDAASRIMDRLETERLSPDDAGIARAAAILRAGGLVAFPTETVYGLGGDALSDMAVARIFAAKGRPRFNPLIAHVGSVAEARRIARFTPEAERLAAAFWPGPLTLVLPLREEAGIAPLVTAGLPTVAVRVPAHPLARQLLDAVGGPVAAPSANPSGKLSPTRAEDVLSGLGGRIAAVLDGGACPVGVESTIVGLDGPARLLRPGGLPAEAIEDCLGLALLPPGEEVAAPGMLASHYAPDAAVRLGAMAAGPGEVLLGFGPVGGDLNLSPAGDLTEAAANLFHHLRALDGAGGRIAVAPIPDRGLGRAINDRLLRAAAPRAGSGAGLSGGLPALSRRRRAPEERRRRALEERRRRALEEAGGCLPPAGLRPSPREYFPQDEAGRDVQARPAEEDRRRASTPMSARAAAHFSASGVAKTRLSRASAVSQPLRWISSSSWPGPQPA
jgi:L-threonylcarbamoyladenylate synthase